MGEKKKVDLNTEIGAQEENVYYDSKKEKAEKEKVPVEYLGYLTEKKKSRGWHTVLWFLILIVVLGIGPGKVGTEYSPRSGEWQSTATFAWGFIRTEGLPQQTEWSMWYESLNPEFFEPRWQPYQKSTPSLFGIIKIPIMVTDYGWTMPDNLTDRMKELEGRFRPGKIMDIPRVLTAVNNGREWDAIILPLTAGTVDEGVRWWNDHRSMLQVWANAPDGTPLDEGYINDAMVYVTQITPKVDEVPLI